MCLDLHKRVSLVEKRARDEEMRRVIDTIVGFLLFFSLFLLDGLVLGLDEFVRRGAGCVVCVFAG